MKNIKLIVLFAFTILMMSFGINSGKSVKCLIQLTNYNGEGAYCTVSLLDNDNNYVKTLYVLGDDDSWYSDIESWFDFHANKGNDIDGITGASIIGGKRKIVKFDLDEKYINNGYKIRFETAVEDEYYYEKDVEMDLVSDNFNRKIEGSGYIRFVRLKK